MKRLMIHLVVALTAFFIGVSVQSVLPEGRPSPPDAEPREVKAPARNVPEVSASVNPAPAAPEFVLDYDPGEFNPRGTYHILGRQPQDLREFESFEVVVEASEGKAVGKVTLYTRYFGQNEDYPVIKGNGDYTVTGSLTERRLAFVATPESEEDFEFRFDGHFLRGGQVSDARMNTAVIKGRLTKLKDGVKVAEREVKLRVEYLGC